MNDCSDPTNIRLRKFSISACCSTVILICGTCLIALHNFCLKILITPIVRKKASLAPIHLSICFFAEFISRTIHNLMCSNVLQQ